MQLTVLTFWSKEWSLALTAFLLPQISACTLIFARVWITLLLPVTTYSRIMFFNAVSAGSSLIYMILRNLNTIHFNILHAPCEVCDRF